MRSIFLVMLALVAALIARPAVAADALSDAQRTAVRTEIHDYLLQNPEILKEMIALLNAREGAAAAKDDHALVAANAKALRDDGYSWVSGNPEGDLTLVEFLDYQCGYCKKAFPEVADLVKSDGNIRLIVKDFPILGPGSELAARAAIAASLTGGPDDYAKLHDLLMRARGPVSAKSLDDLIGEAGLDADRVHAAMHDPEVDRRIAANRALGDRLAITGTPHIRVRRRDGARISAAGGDAAGSWKPARHGVKPAMAPISALSSGGTIAYTPLKTRPEQNAVGRTRTGP